MGRNSIAKCSVSEVVCDRALLGSRLYSGHMWGVESEMGVWLDGEGVGQGHRPDFQCRYYGFINIGYKHITIKYICGL